MIDETEVCLAVLLWRNDVSPATGSQVFTGVERCIGEGQGQVQHHKLTALLMTVLQLNLAK